jgi:beta-glucosidase
VWLLMHPMRRYPGQEGGDAIADVLTGAYNPAGRTAVTWYANEADLPPRDQQSMYAGNGWTYRFFKGDVTFPFGYGLSYTTFAYSNLQLSASTVAPCEPVIVSFSVTNTGSVDGDEVMQVYVQLGVLLIGRVSCKY